jgi:hypothetical protein
MDRRTLLKTGLFSILSLAIPFKTIAKPKEPYVWGQKTLTKSTFERMNVGRTLEHIKKDTQTILKYFTYDINDFRTRTSIKMLLDEYLQKIKNKKGIRDYRVICDETDNTSNVIYNNGLTCDIFVYLYLSSNRLEGYYIKYDLYSPNHFSFTTNGVTSKIRRIL